MKRGQLESGVPARCRTRSAWRARLRRLVDMVGPLRRVADRCRWSSITCIDVIGRKLGYEDEETGRTYRLQGWLAEQLGRVFESTVLQELEWHFHAALFTLVLGYGVVYNTHVRIDLIRDNLAFRKKAWLEFVGLTFFMMPYCAIVIYFAFDYVHSSYMINETSASTVGLSPPLDHQERAGHRSAACGDRRDRGLAAGGDHPVGAAAPALPADDAGLAGDRTPRSRARSASGWRTSTD